MKIFYSIIFILFCFLPLHADSPEINVPVTIIDNFDDGDASDWFFFGGYNAGGGGGVSTDRPKEGSFYFSTGWGGMGTASEFYGGVFKNFDNGNQIAMPNDPYLCFWVLNQSNATVDGYTLEITIREDLDGNGWTDGSEDSFRFDTSLQSSSFNDEWVLISVPLSSFIDLSTGGDGTFNGDLDEIVIVIAGVQGGDPSTVEVDFDEFAFCSGNPCPPSTIPTLNQWGLIILFTSFLIFGLVSFRQGTSSFLFQK
jgi:hypothetical protein